MVDARTGKAAVVVERLRKSFTGKKGETVHAILDMDIEPVAEGEFVSIVGRSGCGKSTLLKIVAGLIPFDDGTVLRRGDPVRGPSRDVGLVFQAPHLVPWRTALDNVLLAADLAGVKKKGLKKRAEELLHLVGLTGSENSYPQELSGGMQHRNAIARSLLLEPSLMLMDEPFSALDALTRDDLMVELQRIWMETGNTILFVTHNISEAVFLSDRIIVMNDPPGRTAAEIEVAFPRPRALDLTLSSEYARVVNDVRGALGTEGKPTLRGQS